MKRITSILSAAFAVLFVALSALPQTAAAAGASGLSIQPRKNYLINPGQTITDKLTIGNLDPTQDLYLTLKMVDFTYSNQSGTPKLNLAQNAQPTPWSLKAFTTLPENITITKGSTKTVTYTITVPKNQGAGSYYRTRVMYLRAQQVMSS
jgi:hypothetical protein